MANLNQDAKIITDKLDSIGNTTATIGKGFAIASAAFTSLALFSAYLQTINSKTKLLNLPDLDLSIVNPILIIGVLIGATLPCVISALTMSSVGRAANELLAETRRQFREISGLSEGKDGVKADVEKCIDNTTNFSLKEMRLPGVVAILSPIIVGKLFGPVALGGMLLGATVIGVVLAFFMANAGGAWDNAKKFIEQDLIEGETKGTNVHRATLVGDAVGDPFKDTAGPSINILIKLMSIVALLIAPTLI
jgi:K(+)-stimulated pyrophosphate-energized sodium pump